MFSKNKYAGLPIYKKNGGKYFQKICIFLKKYFLMPKVQNSTALTKIRKKNLIQREEIIIRIVKGNFVGNV